MTETENLRTLELLRDFIKAVVPIEVYMRNLVLDGRETVNKRLWTLREYLGLQEAEFAQRLGIDAKVYVTYERINTSIPIPFLQKVSSEFHIPLDWLQCIVPIYPIPERRGTGVWEQR